MADAPGHLEKDGHAYPNMSFTLARASTVPLPATIVGARIYVSVDMFGLPLVVRLRQRSRGYDRVTGIALTRRDIYARYRAAVGPPFRELAGRYRILAPHIAPWFGRDGSDRAYLDSEIDAAWNARAKDGFTLGHLGQSFSGRVTRDVLTGRWMGPSGSR